MTKLTNNQQAAELLKLRDKFAEITNFNDSQLVDETMKTITKLMQELLNG
jgi:ribosome assembly protein YihI (activator of Der GTPase)